MWCVSNWMKGGENQVKSYIVWWGDGLRSVTILLCLIISFPIVLLFPPSSFPLFSHVVLSHPNPGSAPPLHSSFGSQQMLSGKQWFLRRAMIRYSVEDNHHTRVLRRSNILINHCHVCGERLGEGGIKKALKVCRKRVCVRKGNMWGGRQRGSDGV